MTMRSVQDRFWADGWVRKLNPLDRYLMLYLLTNEHTNWAGVYELDIGMMAFESGIDRDELERSMLPKLHPKIVYVDGWVWVPNWAKHHMSESGTLSPQQKEGIRKAMDKIPPRIREKMEKGIPYPYPMDTLSPSALSLSSSLNSELGNSHSVEEKDYIMDDENARPVKDPKLDKAAAYWKARCKSEVGISPSTGIPTIRKTLSRANQSLSWAQIRQKMDEWFSEESQDLEDHEKIQITRCFSTFQVDKFKAENA